MNNPTVDYLKQIMPGQSDAWYQRIADDIAAGKMPLPKVEGVLVPESLTAPPQPTINAARQRFLDNSKRSPIEPPVAKPPVKPKSKTQQLKQGTYRSNIPDTVDAALQQASQKPKRPAQPVKTATRMELGRLVRSERAAERLAVQVASTTPGKSEQWCWEKAIFDVERDRH
jgi:hypothetical protein